MGAKGRMLAIEFATRTIRVVEFVPGTAPIQVTRSLTMERPGGEPGTIGKLLKAALARKGFTARQTLVAYSGPLIEHRIYLVPPVTGEVLNELLRRKVAQETTTPITEMRLSGEVVGRASERGVERAEALAVYTPEFEVKRLTFLLVEAGLAPARVASVPLSLASLYPESSETTLHGFVHTEPGRCTIAVSSAGRLRFAREFNLEAPQALPLPAGDPGFGHESAGLGGGPGGAAATASGVEEAASAPAERLVTELTRSLLYFRQVSRGSSVAKLYWSGEAPSADAKALIYQRLKLEISPHPAEEAATWPAGEEPARRSDYAVALGLAKAGQLPDQVNLLPEEYQRRRKRRSRIGTATAAWMSFLLVAGGAFAALQSVQRRYEEVIAESAALTSNGAAARAELGQWSELRKRAEEAYAADRGLRTPFTHWRTLLAWLGASAPPEMTFTSLAIDRTAGGYQGDLRGTVRGRDPSEVQALLNRFLESLSVRNVGRGVLYQPIELRPLSAEEGRGVVQEFRLTFVLSSEA